VEKETNKYKAATLLMSLGTETASGLLEGLPPEQIQEVAVEMARIKASGRHDKKKEEKIVRDFCGTLQKNNSQGLNLNTFLNETVVKLLGEEKAKEIQSRVKEATEKKDIFKPIRSAETDELVLALQEESPQVAAVILSELELKEARKVLAFLDKDFCCKVVWKMANPTRLNAKVKQHMVTTVTKLLKSFEGETVAENSEIILREVAIMLSDLERDLRTQIIDDINNHDEQIATMVKNLMITWEDIPSIADRSLQETLRTAESSKLAIALYQADEEITQKIRSNISSRVIAMVDEEAMLMQEPLEEEILDAREEIVKPLRKANEEGTLRRVKR